MERKNSILVRAYVGDERLDNGAQCAAVNALHDHLCAYYSLFQPVIHRIRKEVVDGKLPQRYDRRYVVI